MIHSAQPASGSNVGVRLPAQGFLLLQRQLSAAGSIKNIQYLAKPGGQAG